MSCRRLALLAVVLGCYQHSAVAVEPAELRHNPFSRPPSSAIPAGDDAPERGERSAQTPDLRATLVGGNSKLADVGGRILRPGDEINGYRLQQVFEDRAVFEIRGRLITVMVKPDLVDNDD